jgi:hypothetical protein
VDYTGAKYYGLSWGQTAETLNRGTINIPLADWEEFKDKEIDAFVSPDYSVSIPASPTKITAEQTVIHKTLTTATFVAVAFTPADLKLTMISRSAFNVFNITSGTYRLVGYNAATKGTALFEKTIEKTFLDGTEKSVEVVLAMDTKLKDLKTIYLDILETLPGKPEESMLPTARMPVTFAAKTALSAAKSRTDVKFTIALDSPLTNPLLNTKFVFNKKTWYLFSKVLWRDLHSLLKRQFHLYHLEQTL